MSIEVNGVSLPDIPEDVLATYPYAVVLKSELDWELYASNERWVDFYTDSMGHALCAFGSTGQDFAITQIWYLSDNEWVFQQDYEAFLPYEVEERSLVWSNHDIYEAEASEDFSTITPTDTIYFPSSVSVSYYAAPKSWYDGMAQQVMRLSETTSKLTTDAMLSALKGVEVGETSLAENERIYQVGGGSMVYDMSGLSFTNSAVGEVTS